jgi:hypothetical protein
VTIEQAVMVLYAIGQLAGTAHVVWRIAQVERKLGNGTPGIFMRRDVATEKSAEIERRLKALEEPN